MCNGTQPVFGAGISGTQTYLYFFIHRWPDALTVQRLVRKSVRTILVLILSFCLYGIGFGTVAVRKRSEAEVFSMDGRVYALSVTLSPVNLHPDFRSRCRPYLRFTCGFLYIMYTWKNAILLSFFFSCKTFVLSRRELHCRCWKCRLCFFYEQARLFSGTGRNYVFLGFFVRTRVNEHEWWSCSVCTEMIKIIIRSHQIMVVNHGTEWGLKYTCDFRYVTRLKYRAWRC